MPIFVKERRTEHATLDQKIIENKENYYLVLFCVLLLRTQKFATKLFFFFFFLKAKYKLTTRGLGSPHQ